MEKVIAESKDIRYVQEPFNIGNQNFNGPFSNQFENIYYKSPEEQKKARSYINSFYRIFHSSTLTKIIKIRSWRDLRRFLSDIKSRATKKSLFKDPLAVMSAEWIYLNYSWDVIVLIRHPAAFVASLKVKDWQFKFSYFLNQEKMMSEYLKEYSELLKEYSTDKKNIIKQGILLWNIIYSTVLKYQKIFSNKWYFIKHEDLSKNPLVEFKKIFKYINIDFDNNVKDFIIKSTTSSEKSLLKRNSKENINTWKDRLTQKEIDIIKEKTHNIWSKFYTENDW